MLPSLSQLSQEKRRDGKPLRVAAVRAVALSAPRHDPTPLFAVSFGQV